MNDAQNNPLTNYIEMSHHWRGQVISHTINLEQSFDTFIARNFIREITPELTDQKTNDFKRLFIWGNMGLTKKKHIVCDLINNYHPELLKTYPKVEKELQKIVDCRNTLAHWQIDLGTPYRWNGFEKKELKVNKLSKTISKIYNEQEVKEIIELCRKYFVTFDIWIG